MKLFSSYSLFEIHRGVSRAKELWLAGQITNLFPHLNPENAKLWDAEQKRVVASFLKSQGITLEEHPNGITKLKMGDETVSVFEVKFTTK